MKIFKPLICYVSVNQKAFHFALLIIQLIKHFSKDKPYNLIYTQFHFSDKSLEKYDYSKISVALNKFIQSEFRKALQKAKLLNCSKIDFPLCVLNSI